MAGLKELLKAEDNHTISFGNYELETKTKVEDFPFEGDMYKVKTFKEITKLEKNGMFMYESYPGTVVTGFSEKEDGVEFEVEGNAETQITVGLSEEVEYDVFVGDEQIDRMTTNLGGKLTLGVRLRAGRPVRVKIVKA